MQIEVCLSMRVAEDTDESRSVLQSWVGGKESRSLNGSGTGL